MDGRPLDEPKLTTDLKRLLNMLGDEEDVFESVAWETPSAGYHAAVTANEDEEEDEPPASTSGPGFKLSTGPEDASMHRGPHDPTWEGYLITSVQDPVKELPETKDAYVSYLVSAKVHAAPSLWVLRVLTQS